MSNLMRGKVYGLSLPAAKSTATGQPASRVAPLSNSLMNRKKPSIFNQSDSDSDNSGEEDWVKKSMKKKAEVGSAALKKQTKIVMSKALEEDPTVFQYDEVYDKIEENKTVEAEKRKEVDRKPKYINNLLKSAEIRKKEYERLIERKVQKEREAEGDQFADKEKFVTSAYRKKMEEQAKEEEEEQRLARMEAALDVTKQNDLSGFYRHIYRQTWGEEKGQIEDRVKKEQPEQEEETAESLALRVKEEMKKIKVESDKEEAEAAQEINIKKISRKKEFRRKKELEEETSSTSDSGSSSGSESSDEEGEPGKPVKKEELSAEEKAEKRKQEAREARERRERRKRKIERDEESSSGSDTETEDSKRSKQGETKEEEKQVGDANAVVVAAEVEPKIDIWKKRTVGSVLEEAMERYWQRVAARKARGG